MVSSMGHSQPQHHRMFQGTIHVLASIFVFIVNKQYLNLDS